MPEIPGGGMKGINQAQELIKELQKQTSEPKAPRKSFNEVMSQQLADKENVSAQNMQPNALKPLDNVNKIEAARLQNVQDVQKTQTGMPSALKSLVGSMAMDQQGMGSLLSVAMSGQQFSPVQMLAMQATTYKLTFNMEAFSKLTETVSGAVKTTMQTQV